MDLIERFLRLVIIIGLGGYCMYWLLASIAHDDTQTALMAVTAMTLTVMVTK